MTVVKFIFNLFTAAANIGGLLAFFCFFPALEKVTKSDPVFYWALIALVLGAVVGSAAVMTFSGKQ